MVDQIAIEQPPADQRRHPVPHVVNGVAIPGVVPADELVDVAVQVLGRFAVIDAVVAALRQRPELLDAVDVHISTHRLAPAAVDGLVMLQLVVDLGGVGVDLRSFGH